MIPKKLHYIWVGGNPLTELAEKCIASWEKHCPDYEIVRWDESNFDMNSNLFCKQAHEKEKWAFAADYIRVAVLAEHGGIYLDTDMELLGSLDKFLKYPAFTGYEGPIPELNPPIHLSCGIIGAEKNNKWIRGMEEQYKDRKFIKDDGGLDQTTIPVIMSRMTKSMYPEFKWDGSEQHLEDVTIFPEDYFYPLGFVTREMKKTENSVAVHHWCASWLDKQPEEKSKINTGIKTSKGKLQKQIANS